MIAYLQTQEALYAALSLLKAGGLSGHMPVVTISFFNPAFRVFVSPFLNLHSFVLCSA